MSNSGFKNAGYKLTELEIYNWTNDVYRTKLESVTEYYFPDLKPKKAYKDSGYKSLHYIIWLRSSRNNVLYPIEIQLRTLLQDVWAELEHKISYKKGNIHPHIKKSFTLLARDLATNDMLLTHLRDINDKEDCARKFFIRLAGPTTYFDYENDTIPKVFEKPEVKLLWKEYTGFVQNIFKDFKKKENHEDWVPTARAHYHKLYEKVGGYTQTSEKIKYILEVEEAFLLFSERKYKEALKAYEDLLNSDVYKDKYVINFRKGELLFIDGQVEEALSFFDKVEGLIKKSPKNLNCLNKYIVKTRLAYTYWSLGTDYIDIATAEIEEAEKIYFEHLSDEHADKRFDALNNAAWYHLEKYIIARGELTPKIKKEKNATERVEREIQLERYYNTAKKKCEAVQEVVESEPEPTCHMYDTVMWFYYQKYLNDKLMVDLDTAQEYCHKIHKAADFKSLNFTAWSLLMNHIQEIMAGQKNSGQQKG